MAIQIAGRLLGGIVLLAVAGGSVVLPNSLEPVLAQEAEAESVADGALEAAIAQMQRGDLPGAQATFEQILTQRRAVGDRLGEAAALTQIGKVLNWQEQYEQSVEQLQRAAQLWDELERPAQRAEALAWLGNGYGSQSKLEPAEVAFREAISLSQSAQNRLGEAEALLFRGTTFIAQQDWAKVVEPTARALSLVQTEPKTSKQRQLEGRILVLVGVVAVQQGEAEKALSNLQEALAIQREVGDRLTQQGTLELLGAAYRGQGQLGASLEAYQESLAIAQVMQVPAVIGRLQYQLGQYPAALSALEQAAETYEALGKREALAQVWSIIGDVYYQQNELEAMETAYEKTASIYESIGKLDALMNYLANQSMQELSSIDIKSEGQAFSQAQEKIDQILAHANYLLKLSRNTGSYYHQVKSLNTLALAYFQKSALETANSRFEQEIETRFRAQEFNQKAIDLIQKRDFLERQNDIDRIRDTLNKWSVSNSFALSTAYANLGQPQNQLKFAQEARTKAEALGDEEQIDFVKRVEASAYESLGQWYGAKADYQSAIDAYEKILAIVPKENESYLTALLGIGQIYETTGRFDKAEEHYQKASQISTQAGNDELISLSIRGIASVYASQGEYRKTIEILENEIARRKALGEKKDSFLPIVFNNLAVAYTEVGEVVQAQALYEEVLEHQQTRYQKYLKDFETGSWNFFCANHPEYKKCQQAEQEMSPAEREHLVEMGAIQMRMHRSLFAVSLGNVGLIQHEQGNYREALEAYEVALSLTQGEEDKAQRAAILDNKAGIYRDQAQYSLAYDAIQEALSIADAEQDVLTQLEYSRDLAEIYADQGQVPKALEIYNDNLQTTRTLGLRPEEAETLHQIGHLQGLKGDYAEALASYDEALALRKDMGDRRQKVGLLGSIGILNRTLGQVDQSLDLHKQALGMSRQLDNKQLVVANLELLGSTYHEAGQPDEALSHLQQALALNRDIGNRFRETFILQSISKLYLEQQQPDPAIAALERSLALAQQMEIRPTQARVLGLLGEAYTQKHQPEQALNALQRSLTLAQAIENRPTEALTLSRLGDLYVEESPEMAIALYKRAVNTYETIRGGLLNLDQNTQQSYANTIADTYRALASLLLEQGRTVEALTVLDLLKVQELQDFLKNVRGQSRLTPGVEFLPEEQQILETFNTLITQQTPTEILGNPALQPQLEALSRTAAEQNLRLKAYADLQTRLKALGQNSALLYPLILEDRIELVLFSPDRPPIRKPVPIAQTDLQAKIQTFTDAIANPRSNIQPIDQDLYQLLIEPIDAELQAANIQTLIYAPDGQMRYVPLAALHDGEQWLGQRYQLNYLTALALTPLDAASTAEPKVLAGAVTRPHTVSVFGQDYAFAGLRYTQPEVESVATQLDGATQLVDEALNRQQLQSQMPSHSIVHLATHAKFTPGTPEDSFILLGDGKTISLREIQDWELPNVELMVLSACETALGERLGNGLEILGFGYQMQRTGSRAAIASLWPIDDGGTQIFMSAFYAGLSQGMSKVEALQAAQQGLINNDYTKLGINPRASVEVLRGSALPTETQLSHPYYWAPFVLIGNGL